MENIKKLIAGISALSMLSANMIPAIAADETKEMAKREYVVSEFVQSVGRNNLKGSDYILSTFKDAGDISDDYSDDISKAATNGIVQGYDETDGKYLKPKENVRRIEAMVMLARCLPETEDVKEAIKFTDVPDWAQEDMDRLTRAGLVEGYGDGRLGAQDNITVEQVKLLTDRSDEALNTVKPGESFYGYINNKAFRNHDAGTKTTVDPIHGAIIAKEGSWSYLQDLSLDISNKETELLEKLMAGELEYEKDSAEQRVHDLYMCITSTEKDEDDEKDAELFNGWKKSVLNAKDIKSLIAAADNIYKETGIALLAETGANFDPDTNNVCPSVALTAPKGAALIAFDKSAAAKYETQYKTAMENYLKLLGIKYLKNDIDKMYTLQKHFLSGADLMSDVFTAQIMKLAADEDYTFKDFIEYADKIQRQHPEIYGDDAPELKAYDTSYADALIDNLKLSERLTNIGYHDFDKILITENSSFTDSKNDITANNLNALKYNMLILLARELSYSSNDAEKNALQEIDTVPYLALSGLEMSDFKGIEDELMETDGVSADDNDETSLDNQALSTIKELLPNDISYIYCKYYYDDETSYAVGDILDDIWEAYINRFSANSWMSDETKANAIKKIENMLAIIGYPDNYAFPEIKSVEDGGTYFNNAVSIRRDTLNTTIRECAENDFVRTERLMTPDTVNAYYSPALNMMCICAGILGSKHIYDPDASYAANLGAIGAVIAHEIGHAFDAEGSKYDEHGLPNERWTEEDSSKYEEIKQNFVDYYNQFEAADGVVQDAKVTITENMADFAGITAVMDIIGDDKEAQKEAIEAFASMWAQIGSATLLASGDRLENKHSVNSVRVNGCVASLDCFYDLYDISPDDPMYVAPDKRLKLW